MPGSSIRTAQTIQRPYTANLHIDAASRLVTINLKDSTFEGSKWEFVPREIRSHTEGGLSLLYQPLWPVGAGSTQDDVQLLTADDEEFFPKSVRGLLNTEGYRTNMKDSDWTLIGIKIDGPRIEEEGQSSLVQPSGEYVAKLVFEPYEEATYADYLKEVGKTVGSQLWSRLCDIMRQG